MTVKAYKSPLGFHYTEEEQQMYYRALAEALKFFETYGRGKQPTNVDRIVRNMAHYDYCRYYEEPVGSIQVMKEAQLVPIEEVGGDWRTLQQLAVELDMSKAWIAKVAKQNGLEFREVMNVKRKIRVYRISEIRPLVKAGKGSEHELTEKELRSGKWMRCHQLARAFGVEFHWLNNLLRRSKVPYRPYTEKYQPYKFYNIDSVRELPHLKDRITRLTK